MNDANQTPDAVREAEAREILSKAMRSKHWADMVLSGHDDDWGVIKPREAIAAILAALDSRAGEDVRPDSWSATPEEVRERAQLLADMELHLKSSRIFITTREKMHQCGVELHDELLGRVTAAIDSIGKAKGHD